MASTASVPTYMLPGVAVCQPPHLEGDPALATEILPGPPPLLSIQQSSGQKRDPKNSIVYSYLPASDPGTTYSGITHGTLIGQESIQAIGKRTRVDKRCVAVPLTVPLGLTFCPTFSIPFRPHALVRTLVLLPVVHSGHQHAIRPTQYLL